MNYSMKLRHLKRKQ